MQKNLDYYWDVGTLKANNAWLNVAFPCQSNNWYQFYHFFQIWAWMIYFIGSSNDPFRFFWLEIDLPDDNQCAQRGEVEKRAFIWEYGIDFGPVRPRVYYGSKHADDHVGLNFCLSGLRIVTSAQSHERRSQSTVEKLTFKIVTKSGFLIGFFRFLFHCVQMWSAKNVLKLCKNVVHCSKTELTRRLVSSSKVSQIKVTRHFENTTLHANDLINSKMSTWS